jgi:uroporphyrinogen-III synthase
MPAASFSGLRVMALENRHADELGKLISTYGGQPTVVPALREVPRGPGPALDFAAQLIGGQLDMVIFLTGAGIQTLINAASSVYPREKLCAALKQLKIVARGSKPASALGELGIKPTFVAPEPNTWREVLRVVDDNAAAYPVSGMRVVVQEYGAPCAELLVGLKDRGAQVTAIRLYSWSLPKDPSSLQEAAQSLLLGEIDVLLLTAGVQAKHLFQVAAAMKVEDALRSSLERMVVASIGPTTSEHLRSLGLPPDLEASQAKMGFLVKEAAERATEILREKYLEPGLDFLHELGSRVVVANPVREVLKRVIDFACTIVNSDSCFVYVLEEDELVLRASKNPHPQEVDYLKLRLGEGITGWVAQHRQPVAIGQNAFHDPRFQFFNELPEDRYEAFLSVPLLCRGRLIGVINLQKREPHSFSKREIRLLSTIGFLVGAGIEMARLDEKSSRLSEELQTRKVVERAKGVLQREFQLSEEQAYLSLRRQSRQLRKSMKEVAEAIVREEIERSQKEPRTS